MVGHATAITEENLRRLTGTAALAISVRARTMIPEIEETMTPEIEETMIPEIDETMTPEIDETKMDPIMDPHLMKRKIRTYVLV